MKSIIFDLKLEADSLEVLVSTVDKSDLYTDKATKVKEIQE